MSKSNSHFRRGSGVFTCAVCKRQTRDTGNQAVGIELCSEDYDLAGIDNEITDGHSTQAERQAEIDRLVKLIGKRGGDVERVKGSFQSITFGEPVAPAVGQTTITLPGHGTFVADNDKLWAKAKESRTTLTYQLLSTYSDLYTESEVRKLPRYVIAAILTQK